MLLRLYLSLLPPRRDLKQRFFIRTTKRRSRMPATQTARKCICLGGARPLVSSVPRSRQGAEMKFRLRRLIAHIKLLSGMCLVTVSVAYAQQPGQQQQNPDRPSTLIVSVRMPDGSPFDLPAVVNLYSFSGAPAGIGTFRTGTAEFDHLPPGSYTLEVLAAGYQKLTEPVQIITAGARQQVQVTLVAESLNSNAPPPRPPILAPSAEKEMTKALDCLRTWTKACPRWNRPRAARCKKFKTRR